MITANEDLELAKQTLQMGAFDYIAKPLNFEYLETVVIDENSLDHFMKIYSKKNLDSVRNLMYNMPKFIPYFYVG